MNKPSPWQRASQNLNDAEAAPEKANPKARQPYAAKDSKKSPYGKAAAEKTSSERSSLNKAPFKQAPFKKDKPAWTKPEKKAETKVASLHPDNPHQGRYDIQALVAALPELEAYVQQNPAGELTIDFTKPEAVLVLNKALLKHHYGIEHWQLPSGYLCPPIPGRMDYLCHAKAWLQKAKRPAKNAQVRMLDIGTGANLIYPILATVGLGWQVTATDIDAQAVANAARIIAENPSLQSVRLLMQRHKEHFFKGIIKADDYFELVVCNPPFFKSQREANFQAQRKWRNLDKAKLKNERNFGGQNNELWCEGGELAFLNAMMAESKDYGTQVGWFTALVSQYEHIEPLQRSLKTLSAADVAVVSMAQGQKNSRFIAWHF